MINTESLIEIAELDSVARGQIQATIDAFPDELRVGRESEAVEWVGVNAPRDIVPELTDFTSSGYTGNALALYVRGVFDGDVSEPTPTRYQNPDNATIYDFDIAHLAVLSACKIASTPEVRAGRLITDIFTRPGFEEKPDSAFGSQADFDFHADGVIRPDTRTDFFSLLGLRNNVEALTLVTGIRDGDFTAEEELILRSPIFRLYYEELSASAKSISGLRLIEDASGKDVLNYYGKSKIEVDADFPDVAKVAAGVIAKFQDTINKNAESKVVDPGDMLIVNNLESLHARQAFIDDAPVGYKRWLRRIWFNQI